MTSTADILVVDDDPDLLESVRLVLEGNGYTVRSASNGREARARAAEKRPDLMILDVMMTTDTEGFDLAGEFKEDPEYANVPIIMLTCFLDFVRQRGPEAFQNVLGHSWPAKWFFEKPVAPRKLLDKVEAILAETEQGESPGAGAS